MQVERLQGVWEFLAFENGLGRRPRKLGNQEEHAGSLGPFDRRSLRQLLQRRVERPVQAGHGNIDDYQRPIAAGKLGQGLACKRNNAHSPALRTEQFPERGLTGSIVVNDENADLLLGCDCHLGTQYNVREAGLSGHAPRPRQ